MKSHVLAMATLLSVVMPVAACAEAVTPRQVREGRVTACSTYGNGCYTAKLVRSSIGWKMRLKGGNVIDCGVTCQDTLRVETVDYWDDQRERSR